MKGFYQYFTELANPKRSLWIFDFDDTLAVDKAKINVVDKESGEVLHSLTSDEFKSYKLKDGEKFDFEGHSARTIVPIWKENFYRSECGDRIGFILED